MRKVSLPCASRLLEPLFRSRKLDIDHVQSFDVIGRKTCSTGRHQHLENVVSAGAVSAPTFESLLYLNRKDRPDDSSGDYQKVGQSYVVIKRHEGGLCSPDYNADRDLGQ